MRHASSRPPPAPHRPSPPRASPKMKTAPVVALVEDVKGLLNHVTEALAHVAYYRSRRGRALAHGEMKLTPERDTIIESVTQAFIVNNVALSVQQIRDLIKRKRDVKVSHQWVTCFVRRHRRELSKRACTALADKRAGQLVFDGAVDFCGKLQAFLSDYHFPDFSVFNYEETRVVQRGGKMSLLRAEASDKEIANVSSTRHCKVASLLTFFSADGGVLLSVYIFKGRLGDGEEAPVNYLMQRAEARTRGTWPRSLCWNDTGYLDAEVFKAVLGKAVEEWSTRNPGMHAMLFGDQLSAHRRAEIVEFAMTLKLFLFSLAPNTSHITQPLDEAPFGALQAGKTRRSEVAVMDAVLTSRDPRDALLLAVYAAERKAFTWPVIQGFYRRRGLWLFNADLMKANVRANPGMVETGETAVEAARSAASPVIQAAQEGIEEVRAGAQSGRAVVKKGVVHSPFLLLDKHRKIVEEAAKEA